MRTISKHNLDEWLFDYFENQLSLEEQVELHSFLEINPECMEEYELWKETYVFDALPENFNVDTLVKEEGNKFFSNYVFPAILLLFVITSGFYTKKEQDVSFSGLPVTTIEKALTREETPQVKQINSIKPQNKLTYIKLTHELKPLNYTYIDESISTTEAGKTEAFPAIDNASVTEISEPVIDKEDKEPNSIKEISGSPTLVKKKTTKEERKNLKVIRKMKKAIQRKRQEEFLKGRKPYVVPMDMKNF
ncbi:MAG: hypothetical protein ACK4ND_04120 [Cytophagaceae bacterium]